MRRTGRWSDWPPDGCCGPRLRNGWAAEDFAGAGVLALALLGYTSALAIGGNGFVAAFVAGLAFGSTHGAPRGCCCTSSRPRSLFSVLVWLVFGAVLLPEAFGHFTWHTVVYAVLSLTVIRMVPVALCLIGSGLDARTVLFVGWFGPRGLASIIFGLLGGRGTHDPRDPGGGPGRSPAPSCSASSPTASPPPPWRTATAKQQNQGPRPGRNQAQEELPVRGMAAGVCTGGGDGAGPAPRERAHPLLPSPARLRAEEDRPRSAAHPPEVQRGSAIPSSTDRSRRSSTSAVIIPSPPRPLLAAEGVSHGLLPGTVLRDAP